MGTEATQRLGVWQVVWSNPHKPRPESFPEVVLRISMPREKGQGAGPCPVEIDECWQEMHSYGYCISWNLEAPPARRLPLESKQRIRRRNLWKRLLSKAPMFAEPFYAEAVAARPEYYGPLTLGEWADVQFARTTMGNLRMLSQKEAA
jgi:hypothetical protein